MSDWASCGKLESSTTHTDNTHQPCSARRFISISFRLAFLSFNMSVYLLYQNTQRTGAFAWYIRRLNKMEFNHRLCWMSIQQLLWAFVSSFFLLWIYFREDYLSFFFVASPKVAPSLGCAGTGSGGDGGAYLIRPHTHLNTGIYGAYTVNTG